MLNLAETTRRLTANAAAIRALVETISAEQADWKPDADTWSMKEVMEHVYNEERVDFRRHLREIFSDPPLAWGAGEPREWLKIDTCLQGLESFLIERQFSLAWLFALETPDWDRSLEASFGPENEKMVLRAGDVLLSWVEHDILHMRQMIELHHAWNEHQSPPYSLQYAGGW